VSNRVDAACDEILEIFLLGILSHVDNEGVFGVINKKG
jgi:hypothetical protein